MRCLWSTLSVHHPFHMVDGWSSTTLSVPFPTFTVGTGGGLGKMPSADSVEELNLPVVDTGATQRVQGDGHGSSKQEPPPAPGKSELPPNLGKQSPFVLSEGLTLIPAKLAARILRGEFMDMAEILWWRPSAETQSRRELSCGHPDSIQEVPARSPGPAQLGAVFWTYMGVIASKEPQCLRQLLALIVRKARRCGGNGWQTHNFSPAGCWACRG